ncbi:helix-turn-helix transcriptional regulator [Alicyclobacillus vulcanalis]|uniref:Two component transcriptional regulator, AraC family n=1 Tax=Alicyclobacillus vulcanalis TaxID=252246 RepID=A0A1N7N733_9BACL|nr:helix-turn-helix domain-containing protein [Alicyclobacillus vulcanalis]SIS94197.1 two component transcriptional regulator, AraC family [Alicyclobacillus vulcanalis]
MCDVLIVDEDLAARQHVRGLLSAGEYQHLRVTEADSAARALPLVRQHHPFAVLYDPSVSDADGLEFGRRVKEHDPLIHVIVASQLKMFDLLYQAINQGFDGYLLKPVNREELYQVFGRLIQNDIRHSIHGGANRALVARQESEADLGNPIESAIAYIEEHFHEPISLQEVAERVYLSPSYFSRLFKSEVGTTFIDYLTQYRIQKSKMLLRVTSLPIEIIANNTGFSNSSYFSTTFKRIVGRTPSEYRAMMSALKDRSHAERTQENKTDHE